MNEMQLLIFCQADSPHMWLKEFTFHSLKKTINKGPNESVIPIFILKPGKYPEYQKLKKEMNHEKKS